MKVSVEGDWGVIDGAGEIMRKRFREELPTEVKLVGKRVKFKPGKSALLYLADTQKVEFAPNCRTAWGHLFRSPKTGEGEFNYKTKPYAHQDELFKATRDLKYYAYEWEMGLGKSKIVLDVAAWKYLKGEIDMLIVVTLNGVHRNWVEREIPTHLALDESKYKAEFWNQGRVEAGMRNVIEYPGLSIACLNFDIVHRKRGEAFLKRALAERKVMLVVDESHNIKTPGSQRTKTLLKYSKQAVCRFIMTGTPITNSPLDAWSQFEFLHPRILGHKAYWPFKHRYAIHQELPGVTTLVWRKNKQTGRSEQVEEPVKVVVGYRNLDELKMMLDPHRSRLLKDDCLDLPPKVYRRHPFELPADFRKAYSNMVKNLVIELDGDRRVTAPMAMTKLLRLQQLVCGFVVPEDAAAGDSDLIGEAFAPTNPRIEALKSVLEEVQGKAIIWAPWRYSLVEIMNMIKEIYGKNVAVGYSGMTPDNARSKAINLFQDPDSGVRFFVGQQQAGGTGITLTAAKDVIYYANTYNYALRLQSEDRAHRIGQTGTVTYTDIVAAQTVDDKIIKALLDKQEIASELSGDILREWLIAA